MHRFQIKIRTIFLELLLVYPVINIMGCVFFHGDNMTTLSLSNVRDNPMELNEEIHSMLEDYKATRNSHTKIQFITPSRFSEIFDEGIQ